LKGAIKREEVKEDDNPVFLLQTDGVKETEAVVGGRVKNVVAELKATRSWFTKRYVVHAVLLILVVSIALQGRVMAGIDHSSLLYTLVSGEEIIEGPLDPSAYAQVDTPGIGGARLAAINADLSVDIITFDDPEVGFAATLGGNAVVAPLSPVVPEPGSEATGEDSAASPKSKKSRVYTVQDGDTIASIAAQFNVSTNTVLWANGLSERATIKVGDHITILPTTGVLHTVKSGDTVLGIAEKYDVKGREIAEYNRMDDSNKLSIGQKIIVPDGYVGPASAPSIVSGDTRMTASGPTPEPAKVQGAGFVWPTASRHISQYFRWGHTGIDIDNRSRPPVYAAQAGTVEFAGWLGGYGNLLIINHGGGLQTYYAHNDIHYVAKGAKVAKGAAIAKMGSTGRSSGPHLHFEVRKGGRPINPQGMF